MDETNTIKFHENNRVGKSAEEVIQHYNDRLDYDELLNPEVYTGPSVTAHSVWEHFKDAKDIRILDVAAGSGKVGIELNKLGFTNLHALEPAEVLFGNSPHKHLYSKHMTDLLKADTVLDIPDGFYDVIVICGGFGVGLIPATALPELIRIVRPGGYIFNAIRGVHFHKGGPHEHLEDYMGDIEQSGKWRLVEKSYMDGFVKGQDGYLFIHEVQK